MTGGSGRDKRGGEGVGVLSGEAILSRLVAMEELEQRKQRTQRLRAREHHELHREEMHKWRHVEEVEQQLRQEVATRKAATKKVAANARKD